MADQRLAETSENQQQYDKFRESFKYYKKKKPPPDMAEVIDFSSIENSEIEKINVTEPSLPPITGLQSWQHWKVFGHKLIPGFIYIRNPFLSGYQEYWIQRCIHDFPCKPNMCNLDAHVKLKEDDNIWDLSQSTFSDTSSGHEKSLMHKLRWVTLGYHHNWDTKHYSADCHSPFPADLDYLTRYVVDVLHLSNSFKAEAAIINYYHMDSTLAPHSDHSEFNLDAPLVSFSFGQSAIMLMGSSSKAQQPVPIFLHSGDIVVMSGPSRLAYHAVPRILPAPVHLLPWSKMPCPGLEKDNCLPVSPSDGKKARNDNTLAESTTSLKTFVSRQLPENSESHFEWFSNINKFIDGCVKSLDFDCFKNYLQTVRINMNVRQVLKFGMTFQDIEESQKLTLSEGDSSIFHKM